MSMHIVGFRPPDKVWEKMKAAWEACETADIPIPPEVDSFFEGEAPGDSPGREVSIERAVSPWKDESSEGYQLELSKLPKDISHIRFFNSW